MLFSFLYLAFVFLLKLLIRSGVWGAQTRSDRARGEDACGVRKPDRASSGRIVASSPAAGVWGAQTLLAH